ncbi:CAAX protease self-immunity [Longilinea arvoryzae]|uniref:CAAX protease self-immunity n=1 Tax=Longilinea arvoryzae TaxID=360412 RepID=A0A0S7BHN1_9CHLR|nr:type II CAAX endopeptidase family protein [Longilinea arvoryzae]GAP14099.1 CAAX protease self-immunity [Longilinea arvoryzae]
MTPTTESTQNRVIQPRVNWRQVGLFIGLTFGFTYVLDLLLQLVGGYGSSSTTTFLQLQMMLPAFFAIFLGMFIFTDSPFYFHKPMPDGRPDRARGFFYLYLALTVFYVILAAISALAPSLAQLVAQLRTLPMILGLLGLIVFRVFKGREAFARANMRGGHFMDWVLFTLAFVAFYALQTGLNMLFNLGQPVDLSLLAAQIGTSMSGPALLIMLAIQTILEGSLLGLVVAFGEEYGWRGFLQGQLTRLGKKRGVLLLGLIWGAWHYPAIWMGHNYPGQPIAGTIAMTLYCVLLAFVLGYVVLKTGSVWLAAFLHAINNQTNSFFNSLVYTSNDPIFSFGLGLYGLATLAVIVLLLLRDPVWKDTPAQTQLAEPAASQVA